MERREEISKGLDELESFYGRRYSEKLVDKIIYAGDVWSYYLVKALNIGDLELPNAIVWPINEEEVSETIKIARKYKIPIIPYGGGAGVTGGAMTIKGGVVVDLKKMHRIIELDEESHMVTVEAGLISEHLEDYLNRHGFMFPHYPMSMWSSTIGGFLATRASGVLSTKYGNMEDLTLGLTAVAGTGEIFDFKPFAKTSSGPDLKKIFIGSEGTLGIITKATLRIFDLPEERKFKVLLFDDIKEAIEFMRILMQRGITPALVRLYDELDTSVTFSKAGVEEEGNLLILMFDDIEPIALKKMEIVDELLRRFKVRELDSEIGRVWWEKRYHKYLANPDAMEMGITDTLETATKWSNLYNLYTSIKKVFEESECMVMAHFSHFYVDTGVIYFTFLADYGEDGSKFVNYKEAWDAALEATIKLNATITHHHGIGLLRGKWLEKELGETMKLLREFKRIMDPDNILNPGKLGLNGVDWG
ncbi:MAG: FAD-binding oxidoreductase [Candidatus Njordarchaeia archaeon]